MRATTQVAEALDRDLLNDHGLSMNEYEVMVVLSESPDRTIRMSVLAAELVNSRSRLTHTIRRMEKRGLVVRSADKHDGRGVNATLTDEGFRVLQAAAPDHVESVRRHIIDRLTDDELRQLGTVMSKLGDTQDALGA